MVDLDLTRVKQMSTIFNRLDHFPDHLVQIKWENIINWESAAKCNTSMLPKKNPVGRG